MTRALMACWWVLALLLAPLWLPLALYARRSALRLPAAQGDAQGVEGGVPGQSPLRLLLVGESTVAGVGVQEHQEGLAASLARALALPQGVHWRALGENGLTARQACEQLLPQAVGWSADWVLLVFGVNDTTHFSSLASWQASVARMARVWQAQGVRVMVTAVPPLRRFSALPWLLRELLGWRAMLMDRALREQVDRLGIEYYAAEVPFAAHFLAEDGYHPSAEGYRCWAQNLAQQLRQTSPN